jgi:hypothetical protein
LQSERMSHPDFAGSQVVEVVHRSSSFFEVTGMVGCSFELP